MQVTHIADLLAHLVSPGQQQAVQVLQLPPDRLLPFLLGLGQALPSAIVPGADFFRSPMSLELDAGTVTFHTFHLCIFLSLRTSFSSPLSASRTYNNFRPISRQLPSMVPGWKFISDPPTNLLPALGFLSSSTSGSSLILITNPFIHTCHTGSVLLREP